MRPRGSSLRLAATLSLLSVLGLALPAVSGAALSTVPDATAGAAVNGTVAAVVRSPARTYLGGNFQWAGTPMAGGAAVSASTGLRQDFAGVTAGPTAASTAVSAVIGDGDDGFYIGGNFTAVAGQPVTNLAHIKKDGALDTTFAPSPNGAVSALALSGSGLVAAGAFTAIGGQAVSSLALLDAGTGAASVPFAPTPVGGVSTLLASGTTLYVGGSFTTIDDQGTTPRLAKLSLTTGTVDPTFAPAPDGAVLTLAKVGELMFAGGAFGAIGGQNATPKVAQLSASTGAVATAFAFSPAPNGQVNALAVNSDASTIFVTGPFTNFGGRLRLAKITRDTTTSVPAVSTWAPYTAANPTSLALVGGALYVGGAGSSIGGTSSSNTQTATPSLAKLDATTAAVDLTFAPLPSAAVSTFAVSGSSIYFGGSGINFNLVNAVRMNGIAALKADGSLDRTFTPAAPSSSIVSALAVSGSDLYVGGTFTAMGGLTTPNLARVDATTGTADTTWKPAPNGAISALTLSGTTLIAGGAFSSIGAQASTPRLAKLSTTGTTVIVDTSWTPSPSSTVSALALSGPTLYAGGAFTTIGGQALTPRLAKLDTTATTTATTVDTDWKPAPTSNSVLALAVSGASLYAGGSFTTIGGQSGTTRLAKVATATGVVDTAFAPAPDAQVSALWRTPGASTALYAGGSFTSIGGQTATPRLARLSATTGVVDAAFAPSPLPTSGATVVSITGYGGSVSVGGSFTSMGATPTPRQDFAQFSDPVAPTITFTSTPASPTVGGSYTVIATGSGSDNPIVFTIDASSTSGACTISGAGVSLTGAGTCIVDANQAADAGYAAPAQAQQTITVARSAQTITFTSTAPTDAIVGGIYALAATGGDSGNGVTFAIDAASTTGACTVSGSTVTFTGAGTCVVAADQAGDADYIAAPSRQQSFAIGAAPVPEPVPPPIPSPGPTTTVVPGPAPGITPPKPIATVTAPSDVSVVGGDAVVSATCSLDTGSLRSCQLDAYATVGHGPRAVAAANRRVLVGHGRRTFDRRGVQHAGIEIALNARGKRLLAEHGVLAVRLVVTARAYGTARALHGTATLKLVAPRPRVVHTGNAGFGVESSALTPKLRAWVRTVAKRIKGYRTATLTGFTEYGGPRAYLPNLALGRARAQAVATALRAGGYRGTLVIRSGGQSHPAQSHATAADRAANRRVEVVAKR